MFSNKFLIRHKNSIVKTFKVISFLSKVLKSFVSGATSASQNRRWKFQRNSPFNVEPFLHGRGNPSHEQRGEGEQEGETGQVRRLGEWGRGGGEYSDWSFDWSPGSEVQMFDDRSRNFKNFRMNMQPLYIGLLSFKCKLTVLLYWI